MIMMGVVAHVLATTRLFWLMSSVSKGVITIVDWQNDNSNPVRLMPHLSTWEETYAAAVASVVYSMV